MKRLLAALTLTTLSAVPTGLSAAAQTGSVSVSPAAGPVGTLVRLQGSGCTNPGESVQNLMFGNQGDQTGTVGGVDFTIPADASGHFNGTFRIPATISNYQGRGGGAVAPGRYGFYSLPVGCLATFTVTPGNLAASGIGPAPIAGVILIILGLAFWFAARRRVRTAPN